MRVIITEATGQIGGEIVEELIGAHELCLIDRHPVPGQASIVPDLAKCRRRIQWKPWRRVRQPRWMEAFKGVDVVVHLAVDQRPGVSHNQLLANNIQVTLNVIEAAVRHHVSRVVFASSNWVVKALERELSPSCYIPHGPKIGSDAPPRPITPYGIAKAFGEISGRSAVDGEQLCSFVAVRIGSYLPFPPEDERRQRWIGTEDIRPVPGFQWVTPTSCVWLCSWG